MEIFDNITSTERLVERYPWWSTARLALYRHKAGEGVDDATRLVAELHPTAVMATKPIDLERLTRLTTSDLIDRFLKRDDYRIAAEEGDAENIAEVEIDDVEDMVSEELAEIYLNQGLYDAAIDTYRKLSLLNSEKSIYFAELIATIERKERDK